MKILFIWIFIFIPFLGCKNEKALSLKEKEIVKDHDYIYSLFLQCASLLYEDSIITIKPQTFANYCMVVGFCESNLNPKTPKGIFQFNKSTLQACGLDLDVENKSIDEQILEYFPKYLKLCGKTVTQKIKTVEDLHWAIFLPNNSNKSWKYPINKTNNPDTYQSLYHSDIHPLDLNKDSVINYTDIKMFHKKHKLKKYYDR